MEIRVCALAGFVIGMFVVLLLVPAQVAQAVTCTQFGTGFGTQPDYSNHFGTGGIGTVVSVSSSCILVRSVYIEIDQDNEAEIGWYQDGSAQSVDKCDDHTTPYLLVWARTAGSNNCLSGTGAVAGSVQYTLENPNHDSTIEYYLNSAHVGSLVGFFHARGVLVC